MGGFVGSVAFDKVVVGQDVVGFYDGESVAVGENCVCGGNVVGDFVVVCGGDAEDEVERDGGFDDAE